MILGLYYIDLLFHGLLTFGWSSIDQILKHEGFFNGSSTVQAQTSGQIFVSSIVKVLNQKKKPARILSSCSKPYFQLQEGCSYCPLDFYVILFLLDLLDWFPFLFLLQLISYAGVERINCGSKVIPLSTLNKWP